MREADNLWDAVEPLIVQLADSSTSSNSNDDSSDSQYSLEITGVGVKLGISH
jgi:hypothetical protein